MAVQSPPYALQNAQHSAQLFRQAVHSPWAQAGVLASGEYAVTAQSTPNMSVQVAAGRAWMKGSQVANVSGGSFSTQSAYFGLNDAPVSLTIATADATNPRIDVVYVAVQDAYYSGSNNQLLLGVVTGTPAASPSAPAAPSNSLTLATVAVAANATSIVSGNISNTGAGSLLASLRGAWTVCTSTTRPSSPTDGQPIFETDSRAFGYYEASTSKWIMFDTQWQTYTPAISVVASNPWTEISYGNSSRYGQYYRKGREITVKFYFLFGSTTSYGGANSSIRVSMPTGLAAKAAPLTTTGTTLLPSGVARGAGTQNNDGFVVIDDTSTYAAADRRLLLMSAGDVVCSGGVTAWAVNAGGHFLIGQATYETNFEA